MSKKKTSECEYCRKPVDYPLPVHRVCALRWLNNFHKEHPPTGDTAILVSKADLDEANK